MCNTPVSSTKSVGPFLIISGHDFRSKRKANLHFIGEELALRAPTRFFSLGYSWLSKLKLDPRVSLWKRANTVEMHNGVACYLWRSVLHPFNMRSKLLAPLERAWFRAYIADIPEVLRQWIAESNTIIIESGMGIALFETIKAIKPNASVLYLASDDLNTIGCSPFLSEMMARNAPLLNGIRITSTHLESSFPQGAALKLIPHGIDHSIQDIDVPSPYSGGINLVSVGSMLFDPSFFTIACKAFPEATFHVIGAGKKAVGLEAPNLVRYGEMSFRDTLAYLKHANVGIAPYESEKVAPYLVDTSMKLMQYGFLGLPAVCPQIVAGDRIGRFGYEPGNRESIVSAIRAALACGPFPPTSCLTWNEVTERILSI